MRDPCTVPWPADAIGAYLAGGREADAGRLIDWLAPLAAALPAGGRRSSWPRAGPPWPTTTATRKQPATATAEASASARRDAHPARQAQVLTDYGAFLHRQGDARQARPVLAEALRLAERLRRRLARRAGQGGVAPGGRAHRNHPTGQLTPQETAVARLAQAGKTNQEIAGQLYLTVNTVETHLRHIYQKLGIHRRAQLPEALTEPPPR